MEDVHQISFQKPLLESNFGSVRLTQNQFSLAPLNSFNVKDKIESPRQLRAVCEVAAN